LKKVEAMKEETSKKGVSRLKKETTKDMVTRWSEGGPRMLQGYPDLEKVVLQDLSLLLHLNILLYI
jgi:hypothetical protein